MTEHRIATTLMRGGTSKGVFVNTADLPPAGPDRDRFILALFGSPDPMQIDGLGGTHSSTSKLMAVSASDEPGVDIDYLFAQISIDEPIVDYRGNCGNLTTAIAPFALNEGMVAASGSEAEVMLRNVNTGVRIRATVPLQDGRAAVEGDLVVAGVPGTGPAITTDFLDPGGSMLEKVLPTGNEIDLVDLADGTTIEVSIVDVTTPHAFVRAAEVEGRSPSDLEAIRVASGALVGLDSRAVPRLAVVSAPDDGDDEADITGRALSMQRIHHAFPLTGALCTAAAAMIDGTIANQVCRLRGDGTVRLRHPKGVIEARAKVDGLIVHSVGVTRSARRLMRGEAFVVLP